MKTYFNHLGFNLIIAIVFVFLMHYLVGEKWHHLIVFSVIWAILDSCYRTIRDEKYA